MPHFWWNGIKNSIWSPPVQPNISGNGISSIAPSWPKHIPAKRQTIADLGSGAGFPGNGGLAIMNPSKELTLIESTGKKANFLRLVAEDLGLNLAVENCRVETLSSQKFNVITARAMAPLLDLINLSKPLMKKDTLFLFPKGQNADKELTESKKYWTFDCEKIPSISDPSGSVLIVKNLKQKNAASHKRR